MIKTFTKLSLIGVLVLCVTTVFAQIPNDSPFPVSFITIDANGNESSFEYSSMADFGLNLTSTVGGEVAWARDDGMYDGDGDGVPDAGYADSLDCSWGTVMPNVAGKVALIRRGACFFSQKIWNAQDAGAIGAIICNNNADDPDELVNMAGADSMDAVVIPAVFISLNSCQILAAQVDAGAVVNAEFRVSAFNSNFGPYAYGTPVDHIIPIDEIQVSLLNVDPAVPQLDVEVSVDVTDPSGTVTTLTEIVDTIQPLENAVIQFEDYVPSDIGTYTMEFNNAINTDVLTNTFKITADTWHMDNENIVDFIAPTEQGFIDDGLRYDFGSTYLTGPDGGIATHATFMLENVEALFTGDEDSDLFQIRLYDMDPDGDGIGPDGTETDYSGFQVVGFADYSLTGNEGVYEDIIVEFDDPAVLKADGQYALMVQYSGVNAGIGIPPHYAFGGTEDYPYYGTFVFTDQLYLGGWNGGWRGVIRMHTDNFVGTTDVAPLAANKINVFPNPTNDYVNLDLDLDANADEVRVGIMDMMGKLVYSRTLNNVQNEVTQFNVSNLSSGTYFMSVVTPEGFRSVKFTVAK